MVLDNATSHNRTGIRRLIEETGHQLEYLPADSPELNPIERKWAQSKAVRQQKRCSVEEVFTPQVIQSFY